MEKKITKFSNDTMNEVKNMAKMFKHIQRSLVDNDLKNEHLNFYGFPEGTQHYHAYRNIKENEGHDDVHENPWRYRCQDSFGLEKIRSIRERYLSFINDPSFSESKFLTINQLAFLYPVGLVRSETNDDTDDSKGSLLDRMIKQATVSKNNKGE